MAKKYHQIGGGVPIRHESFEASVLGDVHFKVATEFFAVDHPSMLRDALIYQGTQSHCGQLDDF